MIKKDFSFKQQVISSWLKHKLGKKETCELLECSVRTLARYKAKVIMDGMEALKDRRHGNNFKLTPKQLSEMIKKKQEGSWRSARKILEITSISNITSRRVNPKLRTDLRHSFLLLH